MVKLSRKENKRVLGVFWCVVWLFELCLDVKDVFLIGFYLLEAVYSVITPHKMTIMSKNAVDGGLVWW